MKDTFQKYKFLRITTPTQSYPYPYLTAENTCDVQLSSHLKQRSLDESTHHVPGYKYFHTRTANYEPKFSLKEKPFLQFQKVKSRGKLTSLKLKFKTQQDVGHMSIISTVTESEVG